MKKIFSNGRVYGIAFIPVKIILPNIFCGGLLFFDWLKAHLLPCPFKYLTGVDCPGCGFQRAVLALMQGHIRESFLLYPPAIPLLLFFAFNIADSFFKLDDSRGRYKKSGFMLVGAIVLISYSFKIWALYHT